MARKLETVVIFGADGVSPLRMNKSDFNPEKHTLWYPKLLKPPQPVAPLDAANIYAVDGWRGLARTAKTVGYEKPDDLSWEESIPEIQALLNGGLA